MRVSISFSLDTDKDRDLLCWLNGLPKRERSKAIREALRVHQGRGGVTLGDIYEAIMDLRRHGLVVAAQNAPVSPDDAPEEPPDVAAALDKLGL